MPIYLLDNTIQHYAWGSVQAMPQLLHRTNSAAKPWAEMWLGAHPLAPSRLPSGEALDEYLRRSGKPPLPYLLKILAAQSPLSIQCHPNRDQAIAGFAREEAAGIPRDAAHRNYRDDNHKPELIVALSEFWALVGFRKPEEIAALFRAVGLESLATGRQHPSDLRGFFAHLQTCDEEEVASVQRTLLANLSALPDDIAHWTRILCQRYPTDIGACAALFLQVVHLQPGQALALQAGQLHSYLSGTGLEIMASSDNVLRGGLTPKHIDVPELLQIAVWKHSEPPWLIPQVTGAQTQYPPFCDDFALQRIALSDIPHVHRSHGDEILLALSGACQVRNEGECIHLAPGQSLFCTDGCSLEFSGTGDLWIASGGDKHTPCTGESKTR